MRISSAPFQSPKPGHANAVNAVTGHAMHMHSHAAGGPPFSSNALMRSPFVGSTDVTGLSPVEVYRQQHEVSATVCILACFAYCRCVCEHENTHSKLSFVNQINIS